MSALDQNLDRLVSKPPFREAIVNCVPEHATVDPGPPGGPPVLRVDGIAMHSRTDPGAEAEAFASRADLTDIDYVLLFGIGGGHALEALVRRGARHVLVLEPDPEVLRLCLSTRPLRVDGCRVLRDALDARATLRDVTRRGQRVLLLGWPPSVRRHREAYDALTARVAEAMTAALVARNTWDLRMAGWIENTLVNLPAALHHPSLGKLAGALRGTPAFLCAAGPSLENNVGLLRGLEGRGLILTVNTAVPALDRHEVRPDLVACAESLDVSTHLRGSPGFAASRFILSLASNPAHFGLASRGLLPFSDQVGYYAGWLASIGAASSMDAGCCAAHAAFSTARMLGCDPIVLVGQDAALTNGQFYAPSTHFGKMRLAAVEGDRAMVVGDEAKQRLHRDSVVAWRANQSVPVHEVEAWGGQGRVCSMAALDYVREWYEEAAQDGGVRIVNATEGGARIAGALEARLGDVLADVRGPRIDFSAIAGGLVPPSQADRMRVADAVADTWQQAVEAKAEARRAASSDLGRRAINRLKSRTRMMLLQGYSRRDVLDVVDRKGDVRELCIALERRAGALADRLEACVAAIRNSNAPSARDAA